MVESGIFRPVIPEIDGAGIDRLERLLAREEIAGAAADGLRRLGALLPAVPAIAVSIAKRLKLSKAATRRLEQAAGGTKGTPRALAYRFGVEVATDLLLRGDRDASALDLARLDGWERPRLPIGGGELIARGLSPGPIVAATLQAIERRWIAEDFPGTERVDAITTDAVDQALRALK
jgi:poly(A) polymerase